MPSKSKSQQRFFGMVDAYKKGELKNASSRIKKAAKGMSMDQVKDFAETKHKGLPEEVSENIVRLSENDIHNMVRECVERILGEGSIEIDPKNKGKFNTTKKATGKSTEELTHSKNPLTRKRAVFAQNAKKWKKGKLNEIRYGGESLHGDNSLDWQALSQVRAKRHINKQGDKAEFDKGVCDYRNAMDLDHDGSLDYRGTEKGRRMIKNLKL